MRTLQNTAVSGPDRGQRRRESMWAWLSLLTLVLCWDASARLEMRVSTQNALMPVSSRPTVS